MAKDKTAPDEEKNNEKEKSGVYTEEDAEAVAIIEAVNINEINEDEPEPEEAPDPAEEVLPEETVSSKDRTEKKKRSKFLRPILFIIIVCFCLFAVADIVSQQNDIEQLRQETEMMRSKIEESKQLGDEYEAMLRADEAEFMERIAVEQLGYSYPNERRFYIVSSSDN